VGDSELQELLNAEIDGELDGPQRGELARRLLADPEARALREDLQHLCQALDALAQVEPPRQLRQNIIDALPQSSPLQQKQWWSSPGLRYAAVIVLALIAGLALYETVHGPKPSAADLVGMMGRASQATILDAVRLDGGPVTGSVSLYRDHAGLALKFELTASSPLDVLITGDGRSLRVNGVAGQERSGQGNPAGALTVELPGLRMSGEKVDLTFLMDGRQVGRATLRAPGGR
jgi:hypothetical protein